MTTQDKTFENAMADLDGFSIKELNKTKEMLCNLKKVQAQFVKQSGQSEKFTEFL